MLGVTGVRAIVLVARAAVLQVAQALQRWLATVDMSVSGEAAFVVGGGVAKQARIIDDK